MHVLSLVTISSHASCTFYPFLQNPRLMRVLSLLTISTPHACIIPSYNIHASCTFYLLSQYPGTPHARFIPYHNIQSHLNLITGDELSRFKCYIFFKSSNTLRQLLKLMNGATYLKKQFHESFTPFFPIFRGTNSFGPLVD